MYRECIRTFCTVPVPNPYGPRSGIEALLYLLLVYNSNLQAPLITCHAQSITHILFFAELRVHPCSYHWCIRSVSEIESILGLENRRQSALQHSSNLISTFYSFDFGSIVWESVLRGMASTAIAESESSVQLRLVEILTGNEDIESEEDAQVVHESDFETVTGYLSTHSTSSIIVKLACQTLEKVANYSTIFV